MRDRRCLLETVASVVSVITLAGCGTTVRLPAGSAVGALQQPAQGLVPPSGAAVPGGLAAPPGAAGGAAGPVPGSAGSVGPAGPTAGGTVGGGAAAPTSVGGAPGVTPTTISVGIPYAVNGAAANQALGGAGITQGDEKGENQAYLDYLNAHGGILGRKIVPIWHAVDALSNDTNDSQYQAMCADFEQDHRAFVILLGGSPIIEGCAQRAGAVAVYENLSVSSAATFRQFPAYFEVSMMDLDRIVLNEARALAAQRYFTPWNANLGRPASGPAKTKVGIVAYDDPNFHHAVDQVLRPQLGRLGYPVANRDTIYITEPQRNSDVSEMSASESNALVKLRQDGVEHVLIIDATGLLTLEFLNDAESQHYYPRYGWSTQNGPEALAGPGDVPKDQMTGSMGIGFAPGIDLTPNDNPDNGPYSNPSRRACLALMHSKGFSFSDPNAKTVALLTCNQWNFLKAAIEAGGRTINQQSFIAGVDRIGSSFQSASTFATQFSPVQHDGAGAYHYYQWDTGCGCMRYTGPLKTAIGEAAG